MLRQRVHQRCYMSHKGEYLRVHLLAELLRTSVRVLQLVFELSVPELWRLQNPERDLFVFVLEEFHGSELRPADGAPLPNTTCVWTTGPVISMRPTITRCVRARLLRLDCIVKRSSGIVCRHRAKITDCARASALPDMFVNVSRDTPAFAAKPL